MKRYVIVALSIIAAAATVGWTLASYPETSLKLQEIILFNGPCKPEQSGTLPDPFTAHMIVLAVVISQLQMLFEVLFSVRQIALCFDRQHSSTVAHHRGTGCNETITAWRKERA
jgi:hypothetical protein